MKQISINNTRVEWIDTLRVAACLMVVVAHACDAFVSQFDTYRSAFVTGVAIGSLMRASVPLFVMMTAALLIPLPESQTLGAFYRKRLGRIVPPMVFWSMALPVLMFLYFVWISPGSHNPQLSPASYSAAQLAERLWMWVLNFNFDTVPLWYLYMLAGLYLVIPVIDAWLRRASRREIKTLLGVWAVTLLIPYLRMLAPLIGYEGNYGHMGLLGECDWNPYGTFYYVSGFCGYVVLAYYLRRWPLEWSGKRMALTLIPMFAVGYVVTFGGFLFLQEYYPGNYAYLEIVWYFTGINVAMMTFALFVAGQRYGGGRLGRRCAPLAGLTFGIYLSHYIFEFAFYDLLNHPWLPSWLRILLTGAGVFAVAAALVWLLKRNRLTSRIVS